MMKKLSFLMFLFLSHLIATATIPNGYYDTATGTGYVLKTQLKSIISNGHIDQGYSALYTLYQTADVDHYYENDGTLLDMYSEIPSGADNYEYSFNSGNECGSYSTEGDCYNREHLVPQSVFGSASPMKSDGHFVVPSDGYVNGRRSNYPFGVVTNPTWTSTNGSKLGSNSTAGYSNTVFEPIDEFKGDIARALFYFATRYEDQVANWSHDMLNGTKDQVFSDWFLAILLQWNQQDPVSQKEIDRNEAVYNFQGNRNPFIDHPEWVNVIWGDGSDSSGNNSGGSIEIVKTMDFDGGQPEWSFTTSVPFFANGSDGFYGIHNANNNFNDGLPQDTGYGNASDIKVINFSGIKGDFLFVNDLDDEGDHGTTGDAIITFASVDVSNYFDLSFNFDYDMAGFDTADYIKYEFFENGVGLGKKSIAKNTEGTIIYQLTPGISSFYVKFYIKQNGAADQAALDNITLKGLKNVSQPSCYSITLTLNFDNYPEETSWAIVDEYNNTISSGGPYSNEPKGGTKTINICLDTGCYNLIIEDAYGDGMCCNYGNGSYELKSDVDNSILANGGSFTYSENTPFCVGVKSKIFTSEKVKCDGNFKIYPNPVSNELHFIINDDHMNKIRIFDINGRLIKQNILNQPGINVQNLKQGFYFIELSSYKKSLIKKFYKN